MPETLSIPAYEPDLIACTIANTWVQWNSRRIEWLNAKNELREYLFATDTRNTENAKLPWKNSTVTPKLTQLRDNLHANYMAALFPSEDWFVWQGDSPDAATAAKRDAIQSYMKQKLRQSDFERTVEQLVLDYIDYGNVVAGHEFVNLSKTDPATGAVIQGYVGPRARRVSPLDVVFDPLASSFAASPFIRRIVRTLGDVRRDQKLLGDQGYDLEILNKAFDIRHSTWTDISDQMKGHGLIVDGFGSDEEYFKSGRMELLEYWGDLYDEKTDTYYPDHVITIIDRRWVLKCAPNESVLGTRPFFHCGWRIRPDNLWAQGPLDQLMGMQYRIDHLENLKADVFDQIAHPVTKTKGTTVEDFEWGPGANIFCGEDGDVEVLRPDTTALNADMQIDRLMQRMEELAGAPQQAMGVRTPGEKTKYEVQVLENGAGRIFQAKVNWFEKNVLEPLLNSMLEQAQRKLAGREKIKIKDRELGVETFVDITKEDLIGPGALYPIGSRHFAEQARFVQELSQTLQTVQALPQIRPHFSGKAAARALEDGLGWRRWDMVKDNVAVAEELETQRLMQSAQESLAAEGQMPVDMQPQDYATEEARAPTAE